MANIAKFIPPKAKYVLEFGFGAGESAADFIKINPDSQYIGIVKSRSNTIERTANISTIAAKDINIDLASFGIKKLDCLIYQAEFLGGKRVFNIIKQQLAYLNTDGKLLFVLENTDEQKIMAFIDKVQTIGIAVDKVTAEVGKDTQNIIYAAICANLTLPEQKINIISTNIEEVCGHVRILQPAEFLATEPMIKTYVSPTGAVEGLLQEFSPQDKNILIIERFIFKTLNNAVSFYNNITASNSLVIHEFDDSPTKWEAEYATNNFLDFKACHAVQTTTSPLADLFREYNPYVLTFPNQLAMLPPKRKYSLDNSRVTIFFGAVNRKADYQDIMPAINKAIAAYGDKLHFLVTADIDFYNALATTSKEYVGGEYNEGTFAPYELYSAALYRSDIALLPLHDNEFNRMKSDLKFIEAAGHGAVVLCSPTVYQNSVRDGRTGFIYHNAAEFFQLLCALIENPLLRKETAQLAYSYVKENRMLADHYEERLDGYLEMLAKMPELEQARQARIAKTLIELGLQGNNHAK